MENGVADPLQFMREQVGIVPGRAAPLLDPDAQPSNIGLPIHPGDAGYRKRIPPPGSDASNPPTEATPRLVLPEGVQPSANPVVPSPVAQQRVVVSFGPKEGQVIVGVETYPDWDMEESFMVSAGALREMLPIIKTLTKLKDLTGGAFLRGDDE